MVTKNTLLMEVMNIPGADDIIKKYRKSGSAPNESVAQVALCYPLFIVLRQMGLGADAIDSIIEEINKLKASQTVAE